MTLLWCLIRCSFAFSLIFYFRKHFLNRLMAARSLFKGEKCGHEIQRCIQCICVNRTMSFLQRDTWGFSKGLIFEPDLNCVYCVIPQCNYFMILRKHVMSRSWNNETNKKSYSLRPCARFSLFSLHSLSSQREKQSARLL